MPAIERLPVDRNAVRLHLVANGFNYGDTSRAFDIKEPTIRQWASRHKWMSHAEAVTEKAVSRIVEKHAETFMDMAERARKAALQLGIQGIEGFAKKKKEPQNWSEAKMAAEIAAKAAGWDRQEQQINVNLWGAGAAIDSGSTTYETEVDLVGEVVADCDTGDSGVTDAGTDGLELGEE